ncbi:hypothetical protein PR003_g7175 [Phytophthora rubi]|uniref:Uncharacterized protein n=1 Tax=Phytophthora rubi TaxID=129364 RepID=A0A6A4FQ96_9STRA|nr:hypothetical protein PR002_g6200 [Phytophthora rubi]KAE9043272.1 hypothetical protein PR001_g5860 [Phytophthora rubi]KAE9346959.1 hypothetical protein PR003_g7175 [Phytophthora rubi]
MHSRFSTSQVVATIPLLPQLGAQNCICVSCTAIASWCRFTAPHRLTKHFVDRHSCAAQSEEH